MELQNAPKPLLIIKTLHTIVWCFFVVCILALPVAGARRQFGWAAALSALVLAESAVLAFNQGRCPMTDWAARYTADRASNFDIYLPEGLARHNKAIFGTLFLLGEVFVVGQWLNVWD